MKESFSFFKKSLKIVLKVTTLTWAFFFASFLRACVKSINSKASLSCKFFLSPQVDSANAGRVLASDAAVFLKKSGLTDLILGKVFNDNYLIILSLASVSILCKLKYLVVLQDMWSSVMCSQSCYPVVSNFKYPWLFYYVCSSWWKLKQYLNLSPQISAIIKVKTWTFIQECIVKWSENLSASSQCCGILCLLFLCFRFGT